MATKTTAKAATKEVKATKTTAKAATKEVKATKTTAKKPAAKKAAKKDMKVNAFVEFFGKQVDEKTIIADVKKAWTKSGHLIGEIETLDLYIKPEEDKAYYVINGTEGGFVAL